MEISYPLSILLCLYSPVSGEALNKHPVPCIGLPEFLWDAEFFSLKYPVEVGNVIETAFIGDLGNGVRGIDQHT